MFYSRDKVEQLRQRYPEGTRIFLDSMENDPRPIPSGTKGTVIIHEVGQRVFPFANPRRGQIPCDSAGRKFVGGNARN